MATEQVLRQLQTEIFAEIDCECSNSEKAFVTLLNTTVECVLSTKQNAVFEETQTKMDNM